MPFDKNKSVIDDDGFLGWGPKILKKEDLIWEGKPERQFSIFWLERGYYHDVASGPVGLFVFVLVLIGNVVYVSMEVGKTAGILSAFLFGVLILVLPDIWLKLSRNRTRYAVTPDEVLFKLYIWGSSKIYAIKLSEIHKITWQEFDDKCGRIYFMGNEHAIFKTHCFVTGKKRIYPTFEMIPNVKEVWKTIESQRAAKYVRKEIIVKRKEDKSTIQKIRKGIIIIQTSFLIITSVFAIDFFTFPQKIIDDEIISVNTLSMGDKSMGQTEYHSGGIYTTAKGFHFSSIDFEISNEPGTKIKVGYSPIFSSVTNVWKDGRSRTHKLNSDLHGVNLIFFIIIFLIFLGGRLLLHFDTANIDLAYLIRMIIVNLFFILFLWFVMKVVH